MGTTLQGQADARLWNRLLALHARVEHRLGTVLQRQHGLGLSEYRALALLAEAADGELRMQDLAGGLGLNQSSVTRLVGRLNDAGFVYRDLCPDDKRGVYTVVTEAGRERYRQARPAYEEALTAMLDEAEEASEMLGEARRRCADAAEAAAGAEERPGE
ncbi:MarR family winged helix-turn-helix transcriptional regulator [Actinomadura rupiterrae]|uniref:MarR family winged helix-turn-helix transcriptional regulator n=1 Tax=Actinomadura rupiterrae TaxID=559627 RepID=UPI0020A36603|nr:MarR family transcriptional regulator [Actinomadura rupiterrae]MCP2337062.1 DNA-binding MarR family transcriptional regulator [Actinomadura rupiterrae]